MCSEVRPPARDLVSLLPGGPFSSPGEPGLPAAGAVEPEAEALLAALLARAPRQPALHETFRALAGLFLKAELTADEQAFLAGLKPAIEELSRPGRSMEQVRGPAGWIQLGFQPNVARVLATEAGSLCRLATMTREQLLRIRGIGPGTVERCETLLGRPFPREPDAAPGGDRLWHRLGLPHPWAMEQAGYHTLDDLGGVTREEFLAHPQLGEVTLARCEKLLGAPLPSYREAWLDRGLPEPLSRRLSSLRIADPEHLGDLAPEHLRERGLRKNEIAALRRWAGLPDAAEAAAAEAPPRKVGNPVRAYWRARGLPGKAVYTLVERDVRNLAELRRLGREAIRRLPGFGPGVLALLAKELGTEVVSAVYWQEQGLSPWLASMLDRAGIRSRADLAARTREEFLALDGLAEGALRQCEELLGHPLPSAVTLWTGHGLSPRLARHLSRLRILTREDLRRLTPAALRQLTLDSADAGRLAALAAERGEE